MTTENQKALDALNDGYQFKYKDGFLIIENPKFKEDNGENPFFTVELKTLLTAQAVTDDDVWDAVVTVRQFMSIVGDTLTNHAEIKAIETLIRAASRTPDVGLVKALEDGLSEMSCTCDERFMLDTECPVCRMTKALAAHKAATQKSHQMKVK